MKNFIKRTIDRISRKPLLVIPVVSHSCYFYLSVETPFTEEEIIDFALLTGKKLPEIDRLLKYYAKNGIHSLWQVNQLAKMGHYCG